MRFSQTLSEREGNRQIPLTVKSGRGTGMVHDPRRHFLTNLTQIFA